MGYKSTRRCSEEPGAAIRRAFGVLAMFLVLFLTLQTL